MISRETAIPNRMRVGVTGHRRLPDDPALADRVCEAIERLREVVPVPPHIPLPLEAISPLAEGADRLVARVVLASERDATLEVPLPLPIADYKADFATEDSCRAFDELLARAARVVTLPLSATRAEAYERVGRYVVDRADVVIALWDGLPARGRGGTAEVVAYARARRTPLLWIHTDPPYALQVELGRGAGLIRE